MTDFLTRIAQRIRGEATVVAPSLPGLFAPIKEAGPTETIETRFEQPGKTSGSADQTAGSAKKPRQATTDADDKNTPQPGRHIQAEDEAPIRNEPPAIQADQDRHVPPMAAPRPDEAPAAPATPSLVTAHNPVATPFPASDRRTEATSAPVAATAEPAPVAAGIPASNSIPALPVPLVAGHVRSQLAPEQAIAEFPAIAEPVEPQEPTVHINIGRVEVRAQTIAPTPAPRPSRPKADSSQSLNNYLKRSRQRS